MLGKHLTPIPSSPESSFLPYLLIFFFSVDKDGLKQYGCNSRYRTEHIMRCDHRYENYEYVVRG